MPAGNSPTHVLEDLRACRLKDALLAMQQSPDSVSIPQIDLLIGELEKQARKHMSKGEIGAYRRLRRHIYALAGLKTHGPDPDRMIREIELERPYEGKILLVSLAGGILKQKVCLRSGDEWHREILRNTVAEIRDLGFTGTRVYPLGGALLRFERNRRILLWGTSDEFGRCEMDLAVQLLRRAFPDAQIQIGN